jgi:hypothetical protein
MTPIDRCYYVELRRRIYQHNLDHGGPFEIYRPAISEDKTTKGTGVLRVGKPAAGRADDVDMDDYFDFDLYERENAAAGGDSATLIKQLSVKRGKPGRSRKTKVQELEM